MLLSCALMLDKVFHLFVNLTVTVMMVALLSSA
jgi:hypothetical protein